MCAGQVTQPRRFGRQGTGTGTTFHSAAAKALLMVVNGGLNVLLRGMTRYNAFGCDAIHGNVVTNAYLGEFIVNGKDIV